MKTNIVGCAVAAVLFSTMAVADSDNPNRANAGTHPGHVGYQKATGTSGGNAGGVPANHFHGGAAYTTGPGGWGGDLSDAVKGDGDPHN